MKNYPFKLKKIDATLALMSGDYWEWSRHDERNSEKKSTRVKISGVHPNESKKYYLKIKDPFGKTLALLDFGATNYMLGLIPSNCWSDRITCKIAAMLLSTKSLTKKLFPNSEDLQLQLFSDAHSRDGNLEESFLNEDTFASLDIFQGSDNVVTETIGRISVTVALLRQWQDSGLFMRVAVSPPPINHDLLNVRTMAIAVLGDITFRQTEIGLIRSGAILAIGKRSDSNRIKLLIAGLHIEIAEDTSSNWVVGKITPAIDESPTDARFTFQKQDTDMNNDYATLTLEICIGRFEITLSELQELHEGKILPLKIPLSSKVEVIHNHTVLAQGNLIDISGEFAVEITGTKVR